TALGESGNGSTGGGGFAKAGGSAEGGSTAASGSPHSNGSAKGGGSSNGNGSAGRSGSGGGGAATQKMSRLAGTICENGKKKGLEEMSVYAKAHRNSAKPKSALLIEAIHATFLPAVQRQVKEIRALGLPEGEEPKVRAFLDAMEEDVQAASKVSR